jgi:putative ABC transport system permease protein
VKALHHKLWRDFWLLRGQSLAIALVVIGGIATMVMAMTNHQALSDTRDRFYERNRFADVFATLKRAPLPLLDEIRALPGVRQAEGRISVGVNLDLPDYPDAVTAQVVSLPEGADGLNQIHLRAGRLPQRHWEAVVGEAFADAHGLHPGDPITAIVNGRRQQLTVSGVGLSPEFIYQIRPGDIFPDFERFTILWMPREALASAFDLSGAFNQLLLALDPGSPHAQVIDAVDRLLLPYGGVGAHDREQQMSHRFLSEELLQLETMTRLFSTIFLSVSAFLLNVVIGRLIGTQREQIAVLKAFGYTRWEVGRHYAWLVLLMVSVGVLPGVALGAWMGRGMAEMYMTFYRFPFLEWSVKPSIWLLAIGFALVAAALGTASGLRRAFRLAPADAMRPEAPPVFRRTLSERIGLGWLLDPAARMVLRNLERRPWRSLLSVIGIGLAGGILVMSRLQSSAIDEMISVQFGLAQRDDLSVTLAEPATWRAIEELASLPGVLAVEAFRSSPVTLRNGHRHYTTALQGLAAPGELKRVLGADLRAVDPPAQGIMLTDHLARMLQVRPGDTLEVEFLEGRREVMRLPVAQTVTEYLGVGAYVQRAWLNRLLREGDVVSGAWIKVEPAAMTTVLQALRERPRVMGVTDRDAAIRSFYDTMAESILTFTLIITFMAGSIAVGVVYNAARITLSERSRDLASLRIMGYTQQEVRHLLLGELATLSILALLPGFALGYGMSALLVTGFQSDLYRIPLVVTPLAFAFSGTVMLVASGLSAWAVSRRLRRLDLVAVLKTQE